MRINPTGALLHSSRQISPQPRENRSLIPPFTLNLPEKPPGTVNAIKLLNKKLNMKSSSIKNQGGSNAFTLLEMFVVISVIGLVVLLLLPAGHHGPHKAIRISCINNLKQVGLAFRMWNDDNGAYPMLFQTNNFDGPSYAMQQKMYVYYQAMSNELSTPKVLVCPADTKRSPGTNFTTDFNNSNVSYFVGLDATETNANMFLAGDRHISNGTPPRNGILELTTNQPASWTQEIHNALGSVALADGSVQGLTSAGLQKALLNTGTNLTRLALP